MRLCMGYGCMRVGDGGEGGGNGVLSGDGRRTIVSLSLPTCYVYISARPISARVRSSGVRNTRCYGYMRRQVTLCTH